MFWPIEITTSDPDTGQTAGGVTLGKQVSDKAFVRFRQQFGQRSFNEFMLEYQLAKFLRLETRLSPETSGSANRLTQRRGRLGQITGEQINPLLKAVQAGVGKFRASSDQETADLS